ncbi:CotH kinase family protein [Flagellimonas myxillae]|uniref:CotH kinase family protein n=1 Tax=Flagellimonas myxillae TaxID=2942214 RepID=UPI00201EE6F3|nr:CotH kinase family protein [Muricauda myxillae]MCL6265030.1 CotH kinase family protein [Muricauda myxillae]
MRYCFLFYVFLISFACSTEDATVPDENNGKEEENLIPPESKLPQFIINTEGGTIVDEPKIDASFIVTKADLVTYEGKLGIEIRGASSQMFPKKSYGFETRDEANEDLDVSLLDYPEEEDWVLYAPYSDKSLMRNMLIYDLSRAIQRYASRTQFVEVTINDAYQGLYVFMEKLKRDSGRIDINKLKDDENSGEDLTGGYILKIDKTAGSNLGEGYNDQNSFVSQYDPPMASFDQKIYFLYEEPDAEDITAEQKTYISNYIGAFETALASDDFTDPDLGYTAYIDVDSFIDFFLLNEISNNVDGYRLSTFMHKDKNGKLKMGPIWDFNLAFGNADYCGGGETNVWAYKFNERCSNDTWLIPFWWSRLMEDPQFVSKLRARWQALRADTFSNDQILDKINAYSLLLNESGAANANFSTWGVLGSYVWPNNFVGNTYESELNYLSNWIENRLSWMDGAINNL